MVAFLLYTEPSQHIPKNYQSGLARQLACPNSTLECTRITQFCLVKFLTPGHREQRRKRPISLQIFITSDGLRVDGTTMPNVGSLYGPTCKTHLGGCVLKPLKSSPPSREWTLCTPGYWTNIKARRHPKAFTDKHRNSNRLSIRKAVCSYVQKSNQTKKGIIYMEFAPYRLPCSLGNVFFPHHLTTSSPQKTPPRTRPGSGDQRTSGRSGKVPSSSVKKGIRSKRMGHKITPVPDESDVWWHQFLILFMASTYSAVYQDSQRWMFHRHANLFVSVNLKGLWYCIMNQHELLGVRAAINRVLGPWRRCAIVPDSRPQNERNHSILYRACP